MSRRESLDFLDLKEETNFYKDPENLMEWFQKAISVLKTVYASKPMLFMHNEMMYSVIPDEFIRQQNLGKKISFYAGLEYLENKIQHQGILPPLEQRIPDFRNFQKIKF